MTLPPLGVGAELRVIAPAGVVNATRIAPVLDQLRDCGIRVTFGEHVFACSPAAPYLAGADTQRADDLNAAFTDPAVGAILCARGGYGCMRLFPYLDSAAIAGHPKPLIGFSDVTALLGFLEARCAMTSLHGPMLSTMAATGRTYGGDALTTQLSGLVDALRGAPLPPLPKVECLHAGRVSGKTIVGNLTLLAACLGTAWFPSSEGRLLIIEDTGESPYRIDRLLTSLEMRGVFDQVAGLAVGDLGEVADHYVAAPNVAACLRARIVTLARRWSLPCVWGLPVGHRQHNRVVPFGVEALLDATAGVLTIETGVRGA